MSEGTGSDRSAGRALAALAVCALALGACSSGGERSTPTTPVGSSTTTTTRVAQTTTTQPPSTDRAAISPVINRLLRRWDDAMTPILAAPKSVAADLSSPLRAALKAVFTADSPYVADFDKLLSGYVDQGLANKAGPSGLVQQTTYLRTTKSPDEDHLSFVWCSYDDSTTVHASTGAVVTSEVGITQGEGTALRLSGQWKLYRLRQLGRVAKPQRTPNPCPSFARAAKPRS